MTSKSVAGSKYVAGSLQIPGTKVEVGRLGLGCARLFAEAEMRMSAQIIETALAAGIRHFDTAPSYHQSEDVLGSVLAGVPDVTLTTKVGMPRTDGAPHPLSVLYRRAVRPALAHAPRLKAALLGLRHHRPPGQLLPHAGARRRLARDEIVRSLEDSLRRLRRDNVDLLLVHEPDDILVDEEVGAVLSELQRSGRTGAFGLAWDRIVHAPVHFGQIIQSRYDTSVEGVSPADRGLRIFHGVLRYGGDGENHARGRRPSDRVRDVLMRNPGAGVIFSASSPGQVREVAEACAKG